MAEKTINQYEPDTVSPPGETLLETLEMHGLSQAELAVRTGRPKQAINEIINGKKEITAETALQLENVLGVPAHFWLAREQNFRESLARQAEAERLEEHTELLKRFPIKEMVSRGFLAARETAVDQLRELLRFFSAGGPDELTNLCLLTQTAFRQSSIFEADTGALNAWLRQGEIIGQQTETGSYNKYGFIAALQKARALTCVKAPDFLEPLKQLCAASGVVVAFVPELPKMRTSGATRWLKQDKALIQLSLRFRWADSIWFSFFHEAGHIVLHGKKEVFLEDHEESAREDEANKFARDTLISPERWAPFVEAGDFSDKAIHYFAKLIEIHPCIVVGRLQYEKLVSYSALRHLKPQFEWK
ncbi:MAG: helix-turn-helix domain-containing protein [Planctomycetes bacterium]|nr:helix-turn-helix domain-containing protein [Planctomycetota bacterium]